MLSESTSKLIAGILLAIGLAFKLGGLQQKNILMWFLPRSSVTF